MPSFRSTVAAVALAFVAATNADYVIDPESVDILTREQWCEDEKRTCPIICEQVEPRTTLVNECDPEKLTYGCLCGDNKRPNVSEYSLTLPFFVCQEWGNQCVKDCGLGANNCASKCREENPCGAKNPKKVKAKASSTASADASETSTEDEEDAIYTGAPGSKSSKSESDDDNDEDSSSGDKPGAATALAVGNTYGLAIVLGGLFAGFALL